MKVRMFLAAALVAMFAGSVSADTLHSESFETDGDGTRYNVLGGFGIGASSQDYWGRDDNTGTDRAYTGMDGSFWFGGQDTVGGESLEITGIDITNYENLAFSALFAEQRPEAGGADDIDVPDFGLVEFQIDGGGFQNLVSFKNDGTGFNTTFLQDTDFSGTGDGGQLETAFASFGSSIAGTGSTLDLRFTASVDSGDEDFAFDNIVVTGDQVGAQVPEPSSLALLGLGALGLVVRRRK